MGWTSGVTWCDVSGLDGRLLESREVVSLGRRIGVSELSPKGSDGTYFGLCEPSQSVTTIKLCCCSVKRAIENM